jgi:hypothetical protein
MRVSGRGVVAVDARRIFERLGGPPGLRDFDVNARLMRLSTCNPLPFRPTTSLERELCDKVEAASGEVVLAVWTPETYPFEQLDGRRAVLAADFQVKTGRLTAGLFASGSIYMGHLRGGHVEVEWEGSWT